MYDRIQMVVVGVLAVVFGLSALSRRLPHITWLRAFRYTPPQLSEEQRARIRRRSNIHAGIEFILMGITLPMLYGIATVMFFSDFTVTGTILVLAGSVLCIGLGVTAIWQNRRG